MTNEIEVNELKEKLTELLEQKKYRELKSELLDMPEADIAEFLDELSFEMAMPVFRLLSKLLVFFEKIPPRTESVCKKASGYTVSSFKGGRCRNTHWSCRRVILAFFASCPLFYAAKKLWLPNNSMPHFKKKHKHAG